MKDKNWWKNKVAYQIYPRSFSDSNGDGIGDINGIISKLDYLEKLGVDIVWLCPVYRSPMDDGGYDISDYYDINPMFGTKDDMNRLIDEAAKHGIKILMDLVVNHCSDEHEWFKKALADPDCEEAGYFWFRYSENGAPNNWRSMFGGSAWENVGGNRYYMHLFSKKQPDLNWENPKLRAKIYEMVNYWLEKGLGGFRIDAITHIKKEPTLSSLPPDGDDGMVGCFASTRNYPGIGNLLLELRHETFDNHECMTVAEAAGVPYSELGDYIGENGYFDTLFDFTYSELYSRGPAWYSCLRAGEWPITLLRDRMFASQLETQKIGFGAVYLENHDYPRAANKFIKPEFHGYHSQTMLGTMFFFLRGIPFIYQGQELGMTNIKMESIEDFDDISSKNHYRLAIEAGLTPEQAIDSLNCYSRDNARVPFPWNSSKNGGFSEAKPWIKVHPDYPTVNAEDEMADSGSVWSYYRKMISIRKDSPLTDDIVYGLLKPELLDYEKLIAYRRGDSVLVICSFSENEYTVTTDYGIAETVLTNYPELTTENVDGKTVLKLKPFQAAVCKLKN